MRNGLKPFLSFLQAALLLLVTSVVAPHPCDAGGVTIITHGLNGDVDGWITGMTDQIPTNQWFHGTNFTTYKMYFFNSGGSYFLTADRVAGSEPFSPESGEILVKLDWRDLADGNSYDTYQIAAAVVPALLSTNFITELGGHALAEFPLHLIGHSRGGSLVCETSRLLGTNGVWVDHITTLDPHPLNDSGFPFDFIYSAHDALARTYVNVLFHDNYWQNLDSFVFGKSVAGAYVRKLTSLNGGYGGAGGAHSDVHLWYHGTIQSNTPASDTEASITSSERTGWWTAYESNGVRAGFLYSLIGGGDRLSTNQPLGAGQPVIRDGFNQWWDLGAGSSTNRTALPSNNGNWPNLIRFNRAQTNQVFQGQSTPLTFYYQWARPATSNATISIYLDDDLNPLNTNQALLKQLTVPANGASFVSFATTNITLATSNTAPGLHAFFAKISGGGRSRYLYAPEFVEVVANTQAPTLDIALTESGEVRIGVNGVAGQTIVLQDSANLQDWLALATNTLAASRWEYTNASPYAASERYYRAVLGQ